MYGEPYVSPPTTTKGVHLLINQPVIFPAGFACTPQQVLNRWEQTLYNLCEEYFCTSQHPFNQYPVLSQVRLPDVIKLSQPILANIQIPQTVVEHITVPAFTIDIQLNAMSFDILITDSQGYPKFILEADGKYHDKPTKLVRFSPVEGYEKVKAWVTQITRDNYKNAIARLAGIPLCRVKVEGMQSHLDLVYAAAGTTDFSRDFQYPLATGELVDYAEPKFDDHRRLLEAADIELCLIRENWQFPIGWKFVTNYELR